MRLFLTMLLLTGYNQLPLRKMYWENSSDVLNTTTSNAMSRDFFEKMLSVLHMSDNNKLDKSSKHVKVKSFYNPIVHRCVEFRPNSENHLVDESMLPYYSRNNSKQQTQNKPKRSGFKMWVLAETLGYVVNFDPYQNVSKCM